jgi:hypothetical protein
VRESDGRLFIATVSYTGSGYGLSIAACASACETAASWQYTALAPDAQAPALALDADGTHHLMFRRQSDNQLVYGACSASCLTPSSWQLVAIHAAFTTTDIGLLRTADRVYALFNAGSQVTLVSCASACTSASSWSTIVADDGTVGSDAAVALVQAGDGRLHLFYSNRSSTELKYASCTFTCETPAGWQSGVAATGLEIRHVAVVLGQGDAPIALADNSLANRLYMVR